MKHKVYSFSETPDDVIRQAMVDEGMTHFSMSLTGNDIEAGRKAVNVGIDAHLEACFCPERGDSYQHEERSITATSDTEHWETGDELVLAGTLECNVSAASLPVLLRRLTEEGSEAAWSIGSAIQRR